jgi:hypothetical protein
MQSLQRAGNQPAFQYRPLRPEKNEIRLLRVSPCGLGDEVNCSLDHVAMATSPVYCALSYTWGDASQLHEISIDGLRFPVTHSLLTALRHFHHVSEHQVLWVDAICINQQDNDERSEQVNKMRSIYEGATEVKVWLGEASENSGRALGLVHDLKDLLLNQGDIARFVADPSRLDQFRALEALLMRPYWKRVWVIQEVQSAAKATVYCGPDSVSWTHMLEAQQALHLKEESIVTLIRTYNMGNNLLNLVWRGGTRGLSVTNPEASHVFDRPASEPPSLFEALMWHCDKLSTYPEDKIYSLIGLTSARGDSRLVIDYDRGARQAFIDVVQYTNSLQPEG